jgi:hypothetical protein
MAKTFETLTTEDWEDLRGVLWEDLRSALKDGYLLRGHQRSDPELMDESYAQRLCRVSELLRDLNNQWDEMKLLEAIARSPAT